ncbi:hypothetical protein PROSTU_04628 [Providencia stuartii ATCC 25827]|uniref:Uncharacterized protein n=1 Tax=Providencia stuartii ATCC 25827 TaxID=471874 RepID=A0AA86YEF0_PROST|nr:hypothetical protein PROSTU_04628 [Providencia stuartii ATCC 25827]
MPYPQMAADDPPCCHHFLDLASIATINSLTAYSISGELNYILITKLSQRLFVK